MNNLSRAGVFAPFVILRPRRFVAASYRLALFSFSSCLPFFSLIILSRFVSQSIKPVVDASFKSVTT